MAIASTAGLGASFIQLLEKLSLLKNPHATLSCNLNSVFSCSNILNAWQSSAFGFPNAVIGIIMFTFFLTAALFMLTGSSLAKRFAFTIQGLAVFMLAFTLWVFYENTFSSKAVCIFCLVNGTSVLVINAVMKRHNFAANPRFKKYFQNGTDYFLWAALWLAVAFVMVLKLH